MSHGRRPNRWVRGTTGELRLGDDWNAITIIRGKERGEPYLKIVDDGDGIPRDDSGAPDLRYVATHIGASLKKRLKEQGMEGIQGEFGIGLLSVWKVSGIVVPCGVIVRPLISRLMCLLENGPSGRNDLFQDTL